MSKTRMHSSRMRTVCSSSHLLGGEVSAPGRYVCSWEFCSVGSAPGGLSAPRGGGGGVGVVALLEVFSWWVVCSGGCLLWGGVCSRCTVPE